MLPGNLEPLRAAPGSGVAVQAQHPQHFINGDNKTSIPTNDQQLFHNVIWRPIQDPTKPAEPDEEATVPLWACVSVTRVVACLELIGFILAVAFLLVFAFDWPGPLNATVSRSALLPVITQNESSTGSTSADALLNATMSRFALIPLTGTDSETSAGLSAISTAASTMNVGLQTMCPGNELAVSRADTYNLIGVQVAMTEVSVTGLVITVMALAGVFQGSRAFVLIVEDLRKQKERTGVTLAEWHISRPDLSRWVEYALTSPIQLGVVALVFGMTSIDTLLMLATTQFGLVIMGAAIELATHVGIMLSDCFMQAFFKVFVLLVASWAMHVSVWWTVLGYWGRNETIVATCANLPWAPDAAWLLMFWQFITFSLFGVSTTLTVLEAVVEKWQNNENVRPESFAARLWARSNVRLSILTALSKTALDVSFLVLIFSMPAEKRQHLNLAYVSA